MDGMMEESDIKPDDNYKRIIEESVRQLREVIDSEEEEREKMRNDLRFVTLDQWPPEVRNQRERDRNSPRPCLTIDKISQYRTQILNDIRKNRPAVKVRPVDEHADPETAQIFQGITRYIEDKSSADIVYEAAAEAAIDCGVGYFRFTTEYEDALSFDQEIKLKPVFDAFSVYMGPHLWPDGSDCEFCFILEDVPEATFKRKYPDAKPVSVLEDDKNNPFWIGGESVRLAEKFYYVYEPVSIVKLSNGQVMLADEYASLPAPPMDASGLPTVMLPQVIDSRETSVRKVKWCKMTGVEVLEEKDWAGSYIPVVKVVGNQRLVDGKKLQWGIVRPAIDSARMYNYWASTITEKLALAPKAPFIAAEGQIEGHEDEWANANTESRAVLTYKAIDVNGNALPAPRRQEPAPVEAAMVNQLQLIEHDIQTSLGMFKASVGQSERDQSGRAIRALQMQSETGTFHFPDNLARSIRHGGRIMVDLIPKIMDTAKIIRILGDDGKQKEVRLNPQQDTARRNIKEPSGIKTIYNLNVGKYDVTITIGPSYATKRMEMVDIIQETMKGNPNLVPLIGDLLFRAIDSPISEKIADRMQKMLPPQLQEKSGAPLPPEAAAQIQQLTQTAQQMQVAIQNITEENRQLKAGVQESQAKIAVDHKEAMAKLDLEKQVEMGRLNILRWKQEQEAQLAKEKVEAQIALDIYAAQHKAAEERVN